MPRILSPDNLPTREDEVSHLIIGAALNSSAKTGIGLMESVCESILAHDLCRRGLFVERQKWISFDFDGCWIENAFRLDLLVEHCVVVEIKSAAAIRPEDLKQLTTYLKLGNYKLGLLINFGVPHLKGSIKRIVNNY